MARILQLLTATAWDDQRQFFKQAPALAEAGHEVIFVAGDPGHAVDCPFRYVPLSRRRRRLARMTGGLNLIRQVLSLRPHLVQLCSIEQLPLGLWLKAATSVRVVYDCREDMFHAMRDSKVWLPRWQRGALAQATRLIETAACRTFDGLVVSDPALYRMHDAMPPGRKSIFYNTPLLSQFGGELPALAERAYDLCLLGSMSRRSGLHVAARAIGELARRGRRVRVLLIGTPGEDARGDLDEVVARHGLEDDVTVTGWKPYTEVPALLPRARIGLVTLLDLPKYHHNIACKAFEYMACGMPCICSDLPPQRFFVEEGRHGLFFEPGNPDSLADAIETLLDDPERLRAMGRAGREAAETRWNAEADQRRYRDFIDRLLRLPHRGAEPAPPMDAAGRREACDAARARSLQR